MRGLNKAMLIGRLGKDPEMTNFESGVVKASFSLATGEVYRNKEGEKIERTDWHNIVMWRKLAEIAGKYLKKGSRVYLEGKIKTRSWDDKDGNKKYITEIEVSDMHMLDPKPSTEDGQYSNQENSSQTMVKEISPQAPDENDLPF